MLFASNQSSTLKLVCIAAAYLGSRNCRSKP